MVVLAVGCAHTNGAQPSPAETATSTSTSAGAASDRGLACATGAVLSPRIPSTATTSVSGTRQDGVELKEMSWRAEGLNWRLVFPSGEYHDFPSQQVPVRPQPDGGFDPKVPRLELRPTETHMFAGTNFDPPCSTWAVIVSGGDEAARRRAAAEFSTDMELEPVGK